MLEFFAKRGIATFSNSNITLQDGERLRLRKWINNRIKVEGRKEFFREAMETIPQDIRPTLYYYNPFVTQLMLWLQAAQNLALKNYPVSGNIALLVVPVTKGNLVAHWDLDQKRIISGRINNVRMLDMPIRKGLLGSTEYGIWIVGEAE